MNTRPAWCIILYRARDTPRPVFANELTHRGLFDTLVAGISFCSPNAGKRSNFRIPDQPGVTPETREEIVDVVLTGPPAWD